MRLNSLSLRGVTRFANSVSVNFSTLPAGLVALVGANGEGKTTLMESIAAALFRQMPSRDGALPNHCQGKDAFIELDFQHAGSHYRSLVKVDAQAGAQEAYLFNGDGNSPLTSGKVKDFDAAIADRVTTPSIFLASVFASQNRKGNFLELSKADRKDLMIRMLGLEELQHISEAAADRAKALETEVGITQAKVASLQEQLEGLAALRSKLQEDEGALAGAQEDLDAARSNLAAHVEREAQLKAEAGRLESVQLAFQAVIKEIGLLSAKKLDLQQRRQNNENLLANAEEVRGAAAMVALLEQSIEGKRAEIAGAEVALDALRQRQEEAQSLQSQAIDIESRLSELKLDAQQAHTARLGKVDAQIRLVEQELSKVRQAFATLEARTEALAREGRALQESANVLSEIPCGDSFPSCSLIAQAIAARAAIPGVGERAEANVREAAELSSQRDEAERRLVDLKAEREAIAAAPAEESPDAVKLRAQAEQHRANAREVAPAVADLEAAKSQVARLQSELRQSEVAIAAARKTAERLPHLEAAETRVAELDQEITQIDVEMPAKTQRHAELADELNSLPGTEDLAQAARLRATAESVVRDRETAIASLQGSVAATRARITDLEALEPELATQRDLLEAKHQDLAEWKHLARAFGKDGIQALEIDAAGPEVSALINELLSSCFGPRFTLSFETTRPKADGKGEREVFDIRIIDNERGREGRIETLSGGEKVILNEAISLALAIYNCRKSGKAFETLFRDETAGALDPVNADRYLQMLRRALELGGFHQLVFIAHQQELWEAADARVFVRGGQVEVA